MARVLLTSEARRHFDLLPATFQDAVLETLRAIEADPDGAGKPLLGRLEGLWSSRVGNYRILYTIEGARRSPTVTVRAVRHRAVAYEGKRRRR